MKKIRKTKKWFKRNKKVIFTVLLMLVAIFLVSSLNNSVFGKLTDDAEESQDTTSAVSWILKQVLNFGSGILAAPFATLITVIGLIVFIVLYLLFNAIGVSTDLGLDDYPFPDNIIFNKLPFFDPNFINPTNREGSITGVLQEVISKLYYTFFIMALTVFTLAAMLIGIKLALSSIASEKAQYKQALNNWVFGIVMLFTVHILMAGIFSLNETLVQIIYDASNSKELVFEFSALEAIPVVGKTISSVLGFVGVDVDDVLTFTGYGYQGMMVMFLWQAIGGDLSASIIFCIQIGQTIALVVMYTKRVFYCVFLGMMAPLIVAADVIQKAIK